MARNRIAQLHADYLLAIVRKPSGWLPPSIEAIPPGAEIIREDCVASYAEAFDDMIRCNRLATRQGLDQWAVILSPGADL